MLTHTLEFPCIGSHRELKKGLESFWQGKSSEAELSALATSLRLRHWQLQRDAGIDLIPVGDFSLYDHVLDMAMLFGAPCMSPPMATST